MNSAALFLAPCAAALALVSVALGQSAPAASGDALMAAGDFAAAGPAYAAALKAAPKDPGLLAGLARLRLYENRPDDAIGLAEQALAATPDNASAQRTLAAARQRKAAVSGQRFRISGTPAEAVIPFVATDPLPIVQVSVGGRTAEFLIDTGAPDIAVSASLAQELGLKTETAGEGVFAGGKRAPIVRTRLPELGLGPVKIVDAPAGVLSQGLPIPGHRIEGVIGSGLLTQFVSTLDYCQGRLVLRPRSASAEIQRAAQRSGANVVPMWLAGDHFILARARLVHGSERLFMIDTGMAGGGIGATRAVLDEAGVAIDPSAAGTGLGGGGPVKVIPIRADATLGSMTVQDVPGFYSPEGDPYSIFPFQLAGTLSHMFFRKSRLTLDFDAMELITEAC